jgi:RNA polymerase sigma-70 factor (ECF subfamily)
MHGLVGSWPERLVSLDSPDTGALDQRLGEAARLAFRVAYSVLRQREDAEDVTQETLEKALRGWRSLRSLDSLRPWLVRVAFRTALDRRRADRRRQRREEGLAPAPTRAADELAEESERRERLWEALDELAEPLRLAIVLVSIEGHDVKEAARLLGAAEGTVKSRLHRARKELAEKLRCLASDSKQS